MALAVHQPSRHNAIKRFFRSVWGRITNQPCRFCNNRGQEGRSGWIESSDTGVFEQSAAQDVCDKCEFVIEIVRCCIATGLFVSEAASSTRIRWYQEGDAPKECDFPSRWSDVQFVSNGGMFYTQFDVFTLPGLAKPFLDFPIKTLPELTSSDDSLKTVQGWLETCDRSHKSCLPQRAGLNTALPKRVLDVSAPLVRLYETHGESARYACLSHCWGATRPACRTTSKKGSPENPSATLEENRKGIEWNALPATFRDAIDFTRRLGIRYLWIDSICIIQDDSADWSEQSGKMANIYENSYITLCATASSSDDGGCYLHTPPHWEPQRIHTRKRDNTEYEVYVRHQLRRRHLPEWDESDDASSLQFPLMRRAWTYQERLLSSRLVHFTAGEIMWECEELSTCECSRPGTTNEKKEYRRAISILKEEHGEELIEGWHAMVRSYSGLDLSFEKDKLPALSGLAQQMLILRPGDQYLAGMWRSSLLFDLCWWVVRPATTRRPLVWRSPSWSWASIDGNVGYIPPERLWFEADYCTCVDVSVTPSGHDLTGELSSAYIVLSAPVMLRQLQRSDRNGYSLVSKAGWVTTYLRIDCQADFESGSLAVGDSLLCLALARTLYDNVFCLVLKQRGGDENSPIYERVGYTDSIRCHRIDGLMKTKTVKIV